MIVLAIIAVLAGMIVPQMAGSIGSVRLRESARDLLVKARSARNFAVTRRRPCRIIIDPDERRKLVAERFAAMDASDALVDVSRHPAMHKTRTVDYIILLSGKVTLLLDDDEVALEPFDVVVQRGTNHAWVNHGDEEALLIAVLVDAEPI